MEIDPRRLRILRAVAIRGGVVDASVLLHLTSSAVSQQLNQLEAEVGLPLLDRSRRRISLTAAGRILVSRAEHIESELIQARSELTALSGRINGPVAVAAFPTVIRHILIPAFHILAQAHPELLPSVVELQGPPALRELRTGGVDVVISEFDQAIPGLLEPGPTLAGLSTVVLADDEYRIVVPGQWTPQPHSIRDLVRRPWLAAPLDSACGQALERIAARYRFTPLRAHHCFDFPATLDLVANGFGAAILPTLAFKNCPTGAVPLTSISYIGSRSLTAIHRELRHGAEPVVSVLLNALEAAVDSQGFHRPAKQSVRNGADAPRARDKRR